MSDTKTIYVSLSIGLAGANQHDELEVDVDSTEWEINQIVREWANSYIDIGWSEDKPKRHW